MRRVAAAMLAAAAASALAACGGKQSARSAPVADDAPCAPCFGDRWEQPPPQIGQTPPAEPAPDEQIDEFEVPASEGSGPIEAP